MGTKITEAQRADFQRVVDQMFEMFLASVAKGRGVSADRVREVADGRVFLAEEAIALGLADGVQSMDATLAGLRARSDRRSPMAAAASRRQSLAISTQTRL
jgi:protease-4